MTHKITHTMFCLLAALLLALSLKAEAITPKPRLTQNEAIRIALDFCHKAGFAVTETPTAQFDAPVPSGVEPGHWQKYWLIKFGKHFGVAVLDASAMVISFGDGSYLGDGSVYYRHVEADSAMPPISDEVALDKALSTVKAMGLKGIEDPAVWTAPRVSLQQMGANDRNYDEVEITWQRLYQGIASSTEWVVINFQAQTSELRTASICCPLEPLHIGANESLVIVSAEQAVRIAAMQLANSNIPNPFLMDIRTEMRRPNGHFQLGSNEMEKAKWERPVWICQYGYTHPQYGDFTLQVYVDSQTGQVVGGGLAGQRHSGKSPAASQIIATAKEVRLYRRGKTGSWPSQPQAILNAATKPETLRQLQKEISFAKDSHLPLGNMKLVVVESDNTTEEFNYDLQTGRLMNKGQSCTVSPELAAQLKALAPSTSPAVKSKQTAAKSKQSAR